MSTRERFLKTVRLFSVEPSHSVPQFSSGIAAMQRLRFPMLINSNQGADPQD